MAATRSPTVNSVTPSTTVPTRRPNSARAANATNRFTITNAEPEIPEEFSGTGADHATVSGRNNGAPSQPQQQQGLWMSAEQEKKAFEIARERVARVQGVAAAVSPTSFLFPRGCQSAENR